MYHYLIVKDSCVEFTSHCKTQAVDRYHTTTGEEKLLQGNFVTELGDRYENVKSHGKVWDITKYV